MPDGQVIGIDFTPEMLPIARQKAARVAPGFRSNAPFSRACDSFVQGDATGVAAGGWVGGCGFDCVWDTECGGLGEGD